MIDFEELFDDLEKRYSIMVVLPKADNFVAEHTTGDIYDFYEKVEENEKLGFKIISQKDDEVLLKNGDNEVLIKLMELDDF